MVLKEFIFIIKTSQGKEYEMTVPAREQTDAERLLKNYLDAVGSGDRIVSLKIIEQRFLSETCTQAEGWLIAYFLQQEGSQQKNEAEERLVRSA